MKRFLGATILEVFGDLLVTADDPAAGALTVAPVVAIGAAAPADTPVPVVAFVAQTAANAALEAAVHCGPVVLRVTM